MQSYASGYSLHPKISLTPLGKKTKACQSLVTLSREIHASHPASSDLEALEASLGGPVTMEDVEEMLIDNPSIDLAPEYASPDRNQTPEIIDARFSESQDKINLLLDHYGFSAPGSLPLDVFSVTNTPASTQASSHHPNSCVQMPDKLPPSTSHDPSDNDPSDDFLDSPNQGGRPTNKSQQLLNEGFDEIDRLIQNMVEDTGHTPENILNVWLQRRSSKRQVKSWWNKYQRYFTDYAAEEKARVGDPDATGKLVNS